MNHKTSSSSGRATVYFRTVRTFFSHRILRQFWVAIPGSKWLFCRVVKDCPISYGLVLPENIPIVLAIFAWTYASLPGPKQYLYIGSMAICERDATVSRWTSGGEGMLYNMGRRKLERDQGEKEVWKLFHEVCVLTRNKKVFQAIFLSTWIATRVGDSMASKVCGIWLPDMYGKTSLS